VIRGSDPARFGVARAEAFGVPSAQRRTVPFRAVSMAVGIAARDVESSTATGAATGFGGALGASAERGNASAAVRPGSSSEGVHHLGRRLARLVPPGGSCNRG